MAPTIGLSPVGEDDEVSHDLVGIQIDRSSAPSQSSIFTACITPRDSAIREMPKEVDSTYKGDPIDLRANRLNMGVKTPYSGIPVIGGIADDFYAARTKGMPLFRSPIPDDKDIKEAMVQFSRVEFLCHEDDPYVVIQAERRGNMDVTPPHHPVATLIPAASPR